MQQLKPYYFFLSFLFLIVLLQQNVGCIKEYSFEGANADTLAIDTTFPGSTDTTTTTLIFPQCSLCNADEPISLGQWDFKTGNTYLCGTYTNSGFFSGDKKTAFTFFGPSACSVDTGIVVSVYLPVALDQDRYNIIASGTAFYYYDHNSVNNILQSDATSSFTVTVKSFIYATGIVEGTFSGGAYAADGTLTYVTNGHFIAPLH